MLVGLFFSIKYLMVFIFFSGTPVISSDGRYINLFPAEGTSNTAWLYAKFDPEFNETDKFDFKWIVKELDSEYHYIADDNYCIYLRTNYRAKQYRFVCANVYSQSRVNLIDFKTIKQIIILFYYQRINGMKLYRKRKRNYPRLLS